MALLTTLSSKVYLPLSKTLANIVYYFKIHILETLLYALNTII